jgi:putative transposase
MRNDAKCSGEHQRADFVKGSLPRLAPEFYRGRAAIHWTLTIEQRRTGWLTPNFLPVWRHTLLHACARYHLVCPAYVLMPDHVHALVLGINDESDQRLAIEFLRKHLRLALAPFEWQHQAHDHVLRESECQHGAFEAVAHYIFENPVRAGLVADWRTHSYMDCCLPGYPELDVRAVDYWERFWRLYNYLLE